MKRKRLKILFVISAVNVFTHYKNIVENLSKKGHTVYLLFDKEWSQKADILNFDKASKGIRYLKWGWLIRRDDFWRNILFTIRELLSYRRYLLFKKQSYFYLNRSKKTLPFILRRLIDVPSVNWFIKKNFVKIILKFLEKISPADKKIEKFVRKIAPDVVLAGPANMRFSEEIEYIKAAKKLDIPTVIPVASWDNLTTKGLLHIIPTKLLVWNSAHEKEARFIHNIPQKNIQITGSSFFDKWFKIKKPKLSRDTLCNILGFEKKDPILLYLGSSATVAKDETGIVRESHKFLANSKNPILKNIQILVRPHPFNFKVFNNLNTYNLTVCPQEGALPGIKKDIQFFYDCLYHSFCTVGINTSAMIDALVLNKPVVVFRIKEYKKTQIQALHFKQLVHSGAVEIIDNMYDFSNILVKILDNQDNKGFKRKQFVKKFVRPLGLEKSAGQQTAEVIEKVAFSV